MVDLKRKSVRGGAVTMVSQAITIGIQLTSTVVLARLLSPDDYGVMAMVMAVTGFAGLFRDLGLSAAAVQKKDLTHGQQCNLFWLNVAMGTLLTVLVAAASPLVAWFYGKPELASVTLALSASFLIASFGTQHGARLVREMQFIRQAVANFGGAILGLFVSITLAFHGFSYWALVWGNLAGATTITLLLFALSPFRPSIPNRGSGVHDMLKFGASVTAFDFVNYFHRNLDNILIGKFWGPISLGIYSRAYSLLLFPLNAIRGPINTVAYPALSRLESEPEAYRQYYHRVTQVVASASMPLCAFLYVESKPIISLALGNQWLGVAPVFSLLAVSGFIQPAASLRGLVMLSRGRSGAYLAWGTVNAVAVSIGFLLGIRWGNIGVAISYGIVNYLMLYPSLILAFKDSPLKIRDFFAPLTRPVFASIGAAIAVSGIDRRFDFTSQTMEFSISALVFGFLYLTILLMMPGGRNDLKFFRETVRTFRSSRT